MKDTAKDRMQVITFKVPYSMYDAYEIACIEARQTMSKDLQQAVTSRIQERQKNIHLGIR